MIGLFFGALQQQSSLKATLAVYFLFFSGLHRRKSLISEIRTIRQHSSDWGAVNKDLSMA